MNWRALRHDPAVVLSLFLTLISAFIARQIGVGMLALATVAGVSMVRKAAEVAAEREHAFWQWLAAGCGFCIAARAVQLMVTLEDPAVLAIVQAFEITFRMAVFAGLGVSPHVQSASVSNNGLLRVRFLSFLVFAQGLIVYFVVIPASLGVQVLGLHPVTSVALILDAALLLCFWLFSRSAETGRWQMIYQLAGISFVAATAADVLRAFGGPGSPGSIALTDFFRLLVFFPLVLASRARFLPSPAPVQFATGRSSLGETIGLVPAAFYAFAFAAIHITFEAAAWLPPETEYARSVTTIACLVLLAAVALREKILSIQRQLRQQRKVQESERFFELVFQNTPGPCFVCDLQGRLRLGNRALEELTGYSIAELNQTDLAEAGLLPNNLLAENRTGRREEFVLKRKDGRLIPIELQLFFIRQGGQRLLLGVARDLEAQKLADKEKQRIHDELELRVASRTVELEAANRALNSEIAERTKTESALRASKARLRSIIDADPECVQILDSACGLLLMNPAGTKTFEAGSFEEIRGRNVEEWIVPAYRDAYREALRGGRFGQQQSIEYEYLTLRGRRRWMKTTVIALEDPENTGSAPHLLLLSKDTTEHRQMQQQLLESQKTGIIGRMAGGVAHEFNNLLTVIKGHAELLEELQRGEMERHSTREILDACRTAAAFTRQLLAVGQKQLIVPEITDANTLVQGVTKDLAGLFKKNLVFDVRAEARQASILVDPRQFRQIILLLANHAQENLSRGSTFCIQTANAQLCSEEAAASANGGKESLQIRATFPGYSDGQIPLQSLFDVFGEPGVESLSRLDLAAVRGTVEQSGGRILAESNASGDLTIVICFPVYREGVFATAHTTKECTAQGPQTGK